MGEPRLSFFRGASPLLTIGAPSDGPFAGTSQALPYACGARGEGPPSRRGQELPRVLGDGLLRRTATALRLAAGCRSGGKPKFSLVCSSPSARRARQVSRLVFGCSSWRVASARRNAGRRAAMPVPSRCEDTGVGEAQARLLLPGRVSPEDFKVVRADTGRGRTPARRASRYSQARRIWQT